MVLRASLLAASLALVLLVANAAQDAPDAPGAEDAVRFRVHAGLHYRRVAKVLASSAALANFTMDLTPPTSVWMNTLLQELQGALVALTPEYTEFIGNVTALIEDLSQRLDQHYNTARLATELTTPLGTLSKRSRARSRRSQVDSPLYVVADLFGACFGFSTYEDVRTLSRRDLQVLEGVNQATLALSKVQQEQVRHAGKIDEVITEINVGMQTLEGALNSSLGNLAKRLTHTSLLLASVAVVEADKLLNGQRMNSINAACSAGLIPMDAVPLEKLKEAVDEVEARLHRRVQVSVADLELLYKLEIATCVFSGPSQLNILVKLPLLPASDTDEWRAYDILPLGFLYRLGDGGDTRVCRLLPHEVMTAISAEGQVRVMSPQQRTSCLARNICEVPRLTEVPGVSRACVRLVKSLFDGSSSSEALDTRLDRLRNACSFTCRPYSGAEVTHLENNLYSVVNMDRDLKVSCAGDEGYVDLQKVREGALLVEVPCRCELIDVTHIRDRPAEVLVATTAPCHASLSRTPVVSMTVPALWTNAQYRLAALAGNFTVLEEVINRTWATGLPVELLGPGPQIYIPPPQSASALERTRFDDAALAASTVWLAVLTAAVVLVSWRQWRAGGDPRAKAPLVAVVPGVHYDTHYTSMVGGKA